mgnify:FL=1
MKQGYGCCKPYEYVKEHQPEALDPQLQVDAMLALPSTTTPTSTEPARYSVVSIGEGAGVTSMALDHAPALKVQHVVVPDLEHRHFLQRRRPHLKVWSSWQQLKTAAADWHFDADGKVDLLTIQADAADTDSLWSQIEDAVIALAPKVVVVQSPLLTVPRPNQPNPFYDMEAKLHSLRYAVDAQTVRSAEHGGNTDQRGYYCVATRSDVTGTYFKWPTPLKAYGGTQSLLRDDVDRRLYRPQYRRAPTSDVDAFTAKRVGFVQGGDQAEGKQVFCPKHPLPRSGSRYNAMTGETGGGYVTEGDQGARAVLQSEQMYAIGFDDETVSQLGDLPKKFAQRVVATAPCVTTHTKVLEQAWQVLEQATTVKVPVQWGDNETTTNKPEHNARVTPCQWAKHAQAVGAITIDTGAVLQHVVMPTFREVREAQRKDKAVRSVMDYLEALDILNDEDKPEPGVKDDAAEKLRKKNVDPKYIRHLDYCYLANGAVMYREVLNDEWLTDALVIPAVYEERAIAAFHDSGYGAHLGAHKTECAMREHVWFPKMKQKIRAYCDNCGACKTAKAFKRHHAGALKSTIYWEVFDDWAIDLQGPFLESVNGNKC